MMMKIITTFMSLLLHTNINNVDKTVAEMAENLHKITLNAPNAVIDPMRQKNSKNEWEGTK